MQRYDLICGMMRETDKGDYVKLEDAEREISTLKALRDELFDRLKQSTEE